MRRERRGHARPLVLRSVAVSFLLFSSACGRPAYVGTDGVRAGTDRPPERGAGVAPEANLTSPDGLSRRLVASKEPPSTLVARDGSRCTATAKRFADTREGEFVWCAWRLSGR